METLFNIIRKSLIGLVGIIFAFMVVYSPHALNKPIENAYALDIVFDPTAFSTQILEYAEMLYQSATQAEISIKEALIAGYTALSAGYDKITSWATNNLWFKEYVLDGIAWAIAKAVISSMVQSLVNWINTGFEGSPAFVQDLLGSMIEIADEAIGQYIEDLGGIGSFVCSPFQLDIQIALSIKHMESRNLGVREPSSCKLSDIFDNFEGFMSHTKGSFTEHGGWESWFNVVSQPEKYTPYGQLLAADIGAQAAIVNAKGEQMKILDFGAGFLSNEVCDTQYGWAEPREVCYIATPGRIIQDALSFNLDSGRQSLITADEIDEIIGALLSQLANTAITGVAGLLGLSGGTGRTYTPNNPYTQQIANEAWGNFDVNAIKQALSTQELFRQSAMVYLPQLQSINSPSAIVAANDASQIIQVTNSTIPELNAIIQILENPNSTPDARQQAIQKYSTLTIYSKQNMDSTISTWDNIVKNSTTNSPLTFDINAMKINLLVQTSFRDQAINYKPELEAIGTAEAIAAANEADAIITTTNSTVPELEAIIKILENKNSTSKQKQDAIAKYNSLNLYNSDQVNSIVGNWNDILN